MNIAVLGCGPAGLFAAHAATERGNTVTVLSKPRKSYMRGAQYLHRPIPGLSSDPFKVDYRLVGSVEGYRDKVYGDMSDVLVSPETLTGIADAWDIREAYDEAWKLYGPGVEFWEANQDDLGDIVEDFDMVINTIPRKALCAQPDIHEFRSQKIWSTNFVKPVGVFGGEIMPDNIVVCSGDPEDWWYRQSRIHGWENTEFPHDRKPNAKEVWEVEKPISTNCDCWEPVVNMGRYGTWTKGVLSDSAYYDTEALLRDMRDIAEMAKSL
jgi:hypothetical protein